MSLEISTYGLIFENQVVNQSNVRKVIIFQLRQSILNNVIGNQSNQIYKLVMSYYNFIKVSDFFKAQNY